jgi:hypothetical protein
LSNTFATGLVKVTETFAPMIERQLTSNGVNMDQYSKQCVVNAISAINTVMDSKGIDWNDQQLDRNNVTQILMNIAALKLNAAASPREVYFQLRNVKIGDTWKKQIEMGVEGDGNDAILARFGRDIEKVGQFWLVREHDEFEYPVYTGFDVIPPKWKPTGRGDVVRVVYPILKKDGTVEYHIAERDDVAKNLIAHINNNLMNETFGVCEDRYKATPKQKQQIAERKAEVLKKAKELGLNALDDPELQKWISPAWTEFQSREQMLIRKMRNNIVKKIPKDFGNAFIEMVHSEATDPEYTAIRKEINENANQEIIDIEPEPKQEQPSVPAEEVEDTKGTTPPPKDEPDASDNFDDAFPADEDQDLFAHSAKGPGF